MNKYEETQSNIKKHQSLSNLYEETPAILFIKIIWTIIHIIIH